MDKLPILCIDKIIKDLTYDKYGDRIGNHELCKDAANLALAGNETFTDMARILWEIIDPGCTKYAIKLYNENIDELKCFVSNYDKHVANVEIPLQRDIQVSSKLRVVDLKIICKQLGCKVSGTKATLLQYIQDVKDKAETEYLNKLQFLDKKRVKEPTKPKCYITPIKRNYIIKKREKLITLSAAKKDYMIYKNDLEKIKCILVSNYPGGTPMRRYKEIDIEKAAKEKYGSLKDQKELRKNREIASKQTQELHILNKVTRKNDMIAYIDTHMINIDDLFDISNHAEEIYNGWIYNGIGVLTDIQVYWDRYQELTQALEARGCELRNDSKLCAKYIDGTTTNNLEYVIERMYEMKFLFTHTNYENIRSDIVDKLIKNKYGYIDWSSVNIMASTTAQTRAVALWKKSMGDAANDFPGLPIRFKSCI